MCMISHFMRRKDFLLHGTYLQKTRQILTYVFNQFYFTQCLTSFSSIHRPSSSLCTVFDSISSNIKEVLPINPLLMLLSLGTLMFTIRNGLPILMELIDLVNSVIIFLSQTTLIRCLTFLRGSQTVILKSCSFGFNFLLMLVLVLQWLSFHWNVVVSVSIDFSSYSQRDAPFRRIAYEQCKMERPRTLFKGTR